VAIIGVLGIVIFSVGLGVLGPQIVRRGSMTVGMPLTALLDKIHVFYQTEAFLRFRNSPSTPPDEVTEVADEALVRSVLDARFGVNFEVISLASPRLPIIAVKENVEIEPFDQPGVAVIYREQLPENAQIPPSNVIVLYMPSNGELRELYARNEFGIPELLREGELVLRCISRGGSQTWIVFWFQGEVLYFLLAPSEEMLDFAIDNTGLPDPVEGSINSA
jgi:hypothetical protein